LADKSPFLLGCPIFSQGLQGEGLLHQLLVLVAQVFAWPRLLASDAMGNKCPGWHKCGVQLEFHWQKLRLKQHFSRDLTSKIGDLPSKNW
jgi:hypothetical protein